MPKQGANSSAEGGIDQRLRRVLHGGVSSILQKCIALSISAISLPLTVRYLGPQQYGIWVTISSMVVMLSVMDLGIANSLTNMISWAYARDDREEARRYYATACWATTSISVLLGLVSLAVWPHVHWGSLFKLTDPSLARQVSQCIAIAFVFFLVSLPLNLINRVLSGYQQTQITNYFNLLSNFLGLLAILVVIWMHGSLVTLMLLYSATLLTGTLGLNLWVHLWDRPWLLPRWGAVDATVVRGLLGSGAGFFALQIASLVMFNSDSLIISHYVGAAEVVPYSVTWKLASYAAVLQASMFPSLWPAYAEAYERGDYDWVRKTFWNAVRFAMGTVVAASAGLILFGRAIIHRYAGPAAVPTRALLLAICLWTMLSTAMDLEACFLAAINRVRLQGLLGVLASLLNLWISIVLIKRIGILGVVLGTISSYVIVLVVPQTVIAWRGLYHPPDRSRKAADLPLSEEVVHGA